MLSSVGVVFGLNDGGGECEVTGSRAEQDLEDCKDELTWGNAIIQEALMWEVDHLNFTAFLLLARPRVHKRLTLAGPGQACGGRRCDQGRGERSGSVRSWRNPVTPDCFPLPPTSF